MVNFMIYAAIFLFALSANLDNFAVAITYGMRNIRIGTSPNLLIAAISGVGTWLCMSAGSIVGKFMPHPFANAIGSLILIGIGLWSIKGSLHSAPLQASKTGLSLENLLKEPEKADTDASGSIDMREAAVLACALTINNVGLGLGASIAGINSLLTTLCTILFSFLSILAGCLVGKKWASRFLGRFAPLIAGIAITALGVFELLF